MKNVHLALSVNGEEHEVSFPPQATLLEVLRENLGLTGTKHGCELGECGCCAVLINGKPLLSCLTLALECGGSKIETIEGVGTSASAGAPGRTGVPGRADSTAARLHPLQETMADLGGAQCGYCTPAIILTAKALLADNSSPTREDIAEALAGNICRCTGYLQIVDAVEKALSVSGSDDGAPGASR